MTDMQFVQDIDFHRRVPRDDLIHHLLGNGKLQIVVQVTENRSSRNALILHLMHPERFRPKSSSFTFHQQLGPEFTSVMLFHENHLYLPSPHQTSHDFQYGISFVGGGPTFWARYPADFTLAGERHKTPFVVHEQIFCPPGLAVALRRVEVVNQRGLHPAPAQLFVFLVPNQTLFPEAHYLSSDRVAVAGYFEKGDEFLALAGMDSPVGHQVAMFPKPLEAAQAGGLSGAIGSCDDDRFVKPEARYTNYPLLPGSPHLGPMLALEFDLGVLAAGASKTIDLIYAYGNNEEQVVEVVDTVRGQSFDAWQASSDAYWQNTNQVQTGSQKLDKFYRAARAGIRASVGETGRMDACIWGFNAEWVRDSSLACVGAVHSGQFEMARVMLGHILEDLTDSKGTAFGEGRFYDINHAEPDQNGELLYALWMYWVHSRDDSLIRNHWGSICATAEYPLRPEFWVADANMIKSERDIRERDRERHGMEPGFELAYQMWVSLGLEKAAQMADLMEDSDLAERWRDYALRIWQAALAHPKYRLVEDDYFMKRRLLDGSFQRFAKSRPYIHRVFDSQTKVYPRGLHREGALEPDHSESYPIALGMLDPTSDLALRTMKRMEMLWNQEWDFGGYPLHNVDSEPTKLGAHLLPIQLITQAAVETRQYHVFHRNIDWLLNTKDARGYTWWEYRDADPAYQIDHGIPPWFGYGEPLVMFIYHLVGYRPQPSEIFVQPHLPPKIRSFHAKLKSGLYWIDLQIHNEGRYVVRATVGGEEWGQLTSEVVRLDLPMEDTAVEIWLSDSIPASI